MKACSNDVELEFSSRGIWRGRALLLEEKTALAFIDRADLLGVPVAAMDHVRREDVAEYTTIKGTEDTEQVERSASWHQARAFVRSLADRDLLFEVVLDDRAETRVVAARGFLTASDTRTVLVSAVFLVGLVTLLMLWMSVL